jgi:hypothetical protein
LQVYRYWTVKNQADISNKTDMPWITKIEIYGFGSINARAAFAMTQALGKRNGNEGAAATSAGGNPG